jgi:hypothetical protein
MSKYALILITLFLAFPAASSAQCNELTIVLDQQMSGRLEVGDCSASMFMATNDSSLADRYRLTLTSSKTVSIALRSDEFDPFLRIYSGDLSLLIAQDDDGGNGLNSALMELKLSAGTYILVANSATLLPETGSYSILVSGVSMLPLGHANYCPENGPCQIGQGDCDSDRECASGLVCKHDVGAKYGFSPDIDVCERPGGPKLPLGHANYCPENGPCQIGQGDCDSDRECASGLVCKHDVGAKYGFSPDIDVCERPSGPTLPLGHANYCPENGPCQIGQGDCDSDRECVSGLVCKHDVGAKYGFSPDIDVCEKPGGLTLPLGHANYCPENGPCQIGQGDCDSDRECASGLVCKYDVGAKYGFSPDIDVCERHGGPTLPLGHANYCPENGPCQIGQGDCDSDRECASGLVCKHDVGAKYGLSPDIDVCESP